MQCLLAKNYARFHIDQTAVSRAPPSSPGLIFGLLTGFALLSAADADPLFANANGEVPFAPSSVTVSPVHLLDIFTFRNAPSSFLVLICTYVAHLCSPRLFDCVFTQLPSGLLGAPGKVRAVGRVLLFAAFLGFTLAVFLARLT